MSHISRTLLAVGIILVDSAVFFLPLTALLAAFIVVFRPRWFIKFVLSVYNKE